MFLIATLLALSPLAVVYLWLMNKAASRIPDKVKKITPHRWTKKEMKETYERMEKDPIDFGPHLPPKLDRRYVVTGGSGLVGGYMILHLLKRGQSPESIRNIDFRAPNRADMLVGKAAQVPFIQADITSEEVTKAAFDEPWPSSVASLPLTVLHPAAMINFTDRKRSMLHKVNAVNLTGTANVVGAAKRAGADVFIATSSASISIKPVNFWIWPWQKYPKNFVQLFGEEDAYEPLRDHYDYFGNYAVSKAHAEKLVMAANSPTFKTGCIRPANGVYGTRFDHTVGTYLSRGDVPTWISHITQNFVDAENISIGHLKYEQALLTPGSSVGGKSFVITDPNPAISFSDIYGLLSTCAVTPFNVTHISPILMLVISYPVEWYHILKVTFPLLDRLLPNLPGDIAMLQPTLFSVSCTHIIASDAAAQRSIKDGGLGYKGVRTTLEGMCMEIKTWNEEHKDIYPQAKVDAQIATEIRNLGTVPAAQGG